MVCWHALAGKDAPETGKAGSEGGVGWSVVVVRIGRHSVWGFCVRPPSDEWRGSVVTFGARHGLPVNACANDCAKKHTWNGHLQDVVRIKVVRQRVQ
jgi:hypothetical protein